MARADSRPSFGAAAGLLLAGAGSAVLALGRLTVTADGAAEAVGTTAWLLGWTLLTWAAVATAVAAATSARHLLARRGPSALTWVLLVAATALVVATAVASPLVGTGAGSA
ncbi:hypothetical protein ACUN7V_07360 [Quadrisphaera oryzae]|uniref:hypothetical protein n=1 Tax=Quadrisphaera TaxID=317661 RepID=UPI0016454BE0|nr:hypothetical protein [Quadrisphaera sp. RL12-1S]MBC3763210.1 hypothetical protein [Quadrisphaera sp. RL12-1S]